MSGKKGILRCNRVIALYSIEEFERLRQLFARSTCRTYGAYVRKVSLEEPVQMVVRNGSFDSFVEEVIALRKEMAAIREEGQFSTGDQERMQLLHVEIQACINKICELCMQQ
jgi:hypothetical protein